MDLQTDRDHCGSCPNACAVDQICQSGSCTCTAGSCPDGCRDGAVCKPGTADANRGKDGAARGACANPAPVCLGQTYAVCTADGQCGGGKVCDAGSCESCDVCADGCAFTSVQAAIDAANSGDTVRVCAGTYGRGASGGFVASIGKNLTLAGAGADATILDGGKTVQVLQVGDVAVTLQDLTVTKGYGDLGGGIYNGGALTLLGVDLTGNHATYGAGIYNSADGMVTLGTGSRVTGNTALNQGGGIAGAATLRTGSFVTDNTAPNGGGGCYALFGSVMIDPGAVICSNTPLNDQCGGQFFGTCPAPSATCP